jgi:large subunit ribosomal protein L24e
MAIAKCAFCGKEQEDYRGTYLMKNDGSALYFSSSKCMKNFMKLKRDKRKIRWTEAFHIAREKRLSKVREKESAGKVGK